MFVSVNPVRGHKRVVETLDAAIQDEPAVVVVDQNIRDRLGYTYSKIDEIFSQASDDYAKFKYSEVLKGYVKDWIMYLLSREKSEHTALTYLSHIRFIFTYMARRELTLDMSIADANRFVTAMPIIYAKATGKEMSPTARNISLYAARSFWKYLILSERVVNNPFDQIEGVKGRKTLPKPLTKQEYINIYNYMHEMAYTHKVLDKYHIRFTESWEVFPFLLLMNSGLRTFELVKLKAEDFELDEDRILWLSVQGKGNKARRVPVVDVYGLFASYFCELFGIKDTNIATFLMGAIVIGAEKPSQRVFAKEPNAKTTKRMLYSLIAALNTYPEAAKSGKNTHITPHQFRHTYATYLLNDKGFQIEEIAKVLGHASLNTTMIYTEVRDTTIKGKLVARQEK